MNVYNEDLHDHGFQELNLPAYLNSGHFISSTFENWESEFLQMGLFIVFTIFLYQKGSSESKDPDKPEAEEEGNREPDPLRKDAPWPVKKGGWWLGIYKYSLTIAMFLLFVISFCLHFYGSYIHNNKAQLMAGKPGTSAGEYFTGSQFWFECMQNWQSEFLSIFAIVFLSIYLRQKNSPQSKPVDEAHAATGE